MSEAKRQHPMIDALELLDRMDAYRRRKNGPPPADFFMRMLEAEVANMAGFPDRNSWTNALKADPTTRYAADKASGDWLNW